MPRSSIRPSEKGKKQIQQAVETLKNNHNLKTDHDVIEYLKKRTTITRCQQKTEISTDTIKRFLGIKTDKEKKQQGLSKKYFQQLCQILELDWQEIANSKNNINQDWGDAPHVDIFFGRSTELQTLEKWILTDKCKLVGIFGFAGIGKTGLSLKLCKGGIGKTDLSLKLAQEIQDNFEYIIWRSLINEPLIEDILTDWIQFLSNYEEINLPETIDEKITLLLKYLSQSRCLIILDNIEPILKNHQNTVDYKKQHQDYGKLFERIATKEHQSCLLLTSREKPQNLTNLEEKNQSSIKSLQLQGLLPSDGKHIFEGIINNFTTSNSEQEWQQLIDFYDGNPLALKLASQLIKNTCSGKIANFLEYTENKPTFTKLYDLIDWHFERLNKQEQEVMYWLAINREPMSISQIKNYLISPSSKKLLLETLQSLQEKITIQKIENKDLEENEYYSLQPMLIEYMTDKLIDVVCQEIQSGNINHLQSHTLLQAHTKDYVRESQRRVILTPIIDRLILDIFGCQSNLEVELKNILKTEKDKYKVTGRSGYLGGNIINLACQLNTDLSSYDFSHLKIWQGYFQCINLHGVDFSYSDLSTSVFMESFGSVHAVAYSPDGKYFAIGESQGYIYLFKVNDRQKYKVFKRHNWWVVSLQFSPDGQKLVSSSLDKSIKIWDINTTQCLHSLEEHTEWIWSVDFHPNGEILASGCDDKTIKIWDVNTGKCLQTLRGHKNAIPSVKFSPDGKILVSGSADKTIKVWNIKTGQCVKEIDAHCPSIFSLAFNSDGTKMVSGNLDRTVNVWDTINWQSIATLQGHNLGVKTVDWTDDNQFVATGSLDSSIKLWNTDNWRCVKSLHDHKTWIWSIAFSPDSQTLISGDNNQILKLWDIKTGNCIHTWHGYNNWVYSVVFSPNGQFLASANLDHTVRLWDVKTGKLLKTLKGHKKWVWSVVFSPDGNLLASASDDPSVKLWDVNTGECLKTFEDHKKDEQGGIWTVAFSPDGKFLATGSQDTIVKLWDIHSGNLENLKAHHHWIWDVKFNHDGKILASASDDHTINLWDVKTRKLIKTLKGHSNKVKSIAFSPDNQIIVSGSEDCTVKLWDVKTGKCFKTLEGHKSYVYSVAFSFDGEIIASSSHDRTIKLWNITDGECMKTLSGHTDAVMSVNFSSEHELLASGSTDQTVRLWDIRTGECVNILRPKRPYEGMNITGVTGITEAQKNSLQDLGALDNV
ncbi:WD40 repeat domain-containing protein [Okeanomitos corallinicola TIOX110]|uniref:WD40 repeat domain-containing protein n=1 Tax=Okeanomitos corallinicola TIOX110 TaxID=3133117 RepID=A0ABZ2UY78_9CYAN